MLQSLVFLDKDYNLNKFSNLILTLKKPIIIELIMALTPKLFL